MQIFDFQRNCFSQPTYRHLGFQIIIEKPYLLALSCKRGRKINLDSYIFTSIGHFFLFPSMENSALTSLEFDKSPYQITLSYADFGILVKGVPTMSLKKIGIKTFIILFYI